MLLNTLLKIGQKSRAFQYFTSDKPILIRHGIQSMTFHKFRSNIVDQGYRNYRNFAYGIVVGVGFTMVWGILSCYQYSCDKVRLKLENIKSKFVSSTVTDLPNDSNKTLSPRAYFNFLADIAEKIKRSVVYIEIIARHPCTGKNFSLSNGSGFIIKSDGLILTNAHVVNNCGQVIVKLYNGQEFSAIVEDIDRERDLATVRITADNLTVLPLGSSANLRPGEFIIAMGNPLNFRHTVTVGVISSVNRQGKDIGLHEESDYIQTDAAMSAGNSGGPLVNLDGEAIGICTTKATEGISFAISADSAIEFLKKIEKKTRIWNPYRPYGYQKRQKFMGLTMLTLSPALIKDLKEQDPDFPPIEHGVLIWKVMIGSPSYKSGINPGDVITKVNRMDVHHASTVEDYLKRETKKLKLTIQRGHNEYEVCVPLVGN